MSRFFGFVALATTIAAIAAASTTITAGSFMLAIVLVASGVLAHSFVTSAEKAEELSDDGEGLLSQVSYFAGMTLRMALGTAVLVVATVSALWFAGVSAGG